MSKVTMIGCDLHDRLMLLKVSVDTEKPVVKSMATSNTDGLIAWLKEFAEERGSSRIVFAYEASGQGFGLFDVLTDAGIECYVLSPNHLPHTTHSRKNKTDEKDAQMILDEVRSHVLAGKKLPTVWVPDAQTRDDREAVRLRLDLGEQRTQVKNRIRNLAKRSKLAFPGWFTTSGNWSRRSMQWLRGVASGTVKDRPEFKHVGNSSEVEACTVPIELGAGVRTALDSHLKLYEHLTEQIKALDDQIALLSKKNRYVAACTKLMDMTGVGRLSAMVFLTELGDLNRFKNRRQLGAYLGLAPSAFESGEKNDRKGRITHQGPARVRHVLCQAAWAAQRWSDEWKEMYQRIKNGKKNRSKVAIVAVMRKLGIAMWHTARDANQPKTDPAANTRAQQKGPAPSVLTVASASA